MTDDGAFGDMVAKTDDGAFGNEVARMISLCSIIESNSYLRSPKSKQINLGLLLGTRFFSQTDKVLVCYGVAGPSALFHPNLGEEL